MAYWTDWRPARVRGRRWVAATLHAAILACAVPAAAQTSTDELARRHFESGAAYLEQSEYESALREFDKAYELSKRPEILINLATVHERMGNLDDAIASLEKYLAEAPTGEHADTVNVRLANLKERRAKFASQKPATEPTPAPAPAAKPDQKPMPGAVGAPAPSPEADQGSSKLPAYVLFSVAGVAAAGSILTGILAQSEHSELEDSCAPDCTDDQVATGRALAVTSTVLTGVAVVTGAIGAVLFFNSGPDETARRRGPEVGLGIGPRAGVAHARWRF